LGHGFVGLVVEVEGAASASVVAHDAFKDDGGAIFGTLQLSEDGVGCDGSADDADVVAVCGLGIGLGLGLGRAAADRREQSDFVAGMQRAIGSGVFLIYRQRERGKKFFKPGSATDVMRKHVVEAGAFGQIDEFGGVAEEVFEEAEE
jgi:hypothetical protein